MKIYEGTYHWQGWGGRLALGSGKCKLAVFRKEEKAEITPLKEYVVVVSDIPGQTLSVKSCAGHIATSIVRDFNIPPKRMLFVEFSPGSVYGKGKIISQRLEVVEFTWVNEKAIQPRWFPMSSEMEMDVRNLVKKLWIGTDRGIHPV